MRTSTLLLATALLGGVVALSHTSHADPFSTGDSYGPRQPSGVTQVDPLAEQRKTNRAWQAEAFDHQGERGGCNADFVPTWAMGPRTFGGCYADSFGKATEGN